MMPFCVLFQANNATLALWALICGLVLLMVLLNAIFIVTTMLPGLKLAAFWVAQVTA